MFFYFKGPLLYVAGPVACLMPSYMKLIPDSKTTLTQRSEFIAHYIRPTLFADVGPM